MERLNSSYGNNLIVSGPADFQKGNTWNKEVWQATNHLGTVTLHLSALGNILKKCYYTPCRETPGIKARNPYCKNSKSGLYYYDPRFISTGAEDFSLIWV